MKKHLASLLVVLVGAALLAPQPASATNILFAGGEDISFTPIGTTQYSLSCAGLACRSTFARYAIGGVNSTTVADPPANRMQTPTFTAGSNIWVHGQFFNAVNTTTLNEQGVILRSPDGVSRIIVRQTGTAGQLKVSTRKSDGTITDLATATGTYSTGITAFDLYVNFTCSGAGGVQLYLANVQVINYSGSPCTTDPATQLNQADFASLNNTATLCTINNGFCWSEIIIADADTRGMALWTLAPAAAGNTQSWTPNTVGNVNPFIFNDLTSVATGSNNALSQWTTPVAAPSGAWNVLAVSQEARLAVGLTGPQHFEWLLRTKDGTNNVTGSMAPLLVNFSNFTNQIWAVNPTTSAAWSISDIAAGFNLGVESLN
jgi:hypothetical protein